MSQSSKVSDSSHILTAITTLSDRNLYDASDADNGHRMAAIIRSGKSLPILDFTRAQRFVRKYSDLLTPTKSVVISPHRSGLNEQQSEAFDGVVSWYRNSYGSKQAIIVGYAGTGKTFSCQNISRELIENDRAKICMTAFTHKACGVLKEMALQAGLDVEVRTICSLLGLAPEPDKKGKYKIKKKGEDTSYKYDVVWVDEGSMVGHQLNEYIEMMEARYVVMGDPCQLPDVETGLESPVFTTIKERWDLTKVVRYDGAILRRVTDIRENITSKKLPTAKYEKNVFDWFTNSQWIENLIERNKKLIQDGNQDPNAIRALAWSNARVQTVNHTVRTALYGDHALPYIVGERLVAKDMIEVQHPDGDWRSGCTWETGSNTVLMYSCDECVIKGVKYGSKTVFGATFEGWFLDIETDLGDEATIFTPDEKEKSKIIQVCGIYKKKILDMHFSDPKRPQSWAIFYKQLNQLGVKMSGDGFMRKLQYCHCMTVHQSQGSTFKTVFADVSNVFGCPEIELRNKLLYVQLSRASQELYELNNF